MQTSLSFQDAMDKGDAVVKNGLCNVCKGSRNLCGKDRCPLMLKFYSREKLMPKINTRDIAGSSPPAVFVGRYGYPKVDIGPLLPAEFGDTSLMDSPERWVGRSVDEIADLRFGLIRGKYRIDATDFRKAGRVVDSVQEIALTEKSIDVETQFDRKPTGRLVLDDAVQPFGPSGKIEQMTIGNGRFERNLEKSFYDVDMRSADAVMAAYGNGTAVSEIQKAFSVGTMGVGRNRRFVPTRWSITAVDDMIGKSLSKEVRFNPTIDEYRLYTWTGLDNRWCIVMLPTTWRYEMIEAWFPQSSWNPSASRIDFAADHEPFDGMTHYAANEGAYYAARLAVTEMLNAQGRSAAVIVLREIHPGYDIPLGVWNIRENVREALRHPPIAGESLEQLWPHIESYMDVRRETWFSHSAILKDWKVQKRIEDFYRASSRNPYIRMVSRDSMDKQMVVSLGVVGILAIAGICVAGYGAEGGISILDDDIVKKMGIKTNDVKVDVEDPSSLEEWMETEEYQNIVLKLINKYIDDYNDADKDLENAYKKLAKLYNDAKIDEDDLTDGGGIIEIYQYQRAEGDCLLVFLAKCLNSCGAVDSFESFVITDFKEEFPNLCQLLEQNSIEINGETIMNCHTVFTGLDQEALRAALAADEASGHILSEYLSFNGLFESYISAILAPSKIAPYLDGIYGKMTASNAAEAKKLVDYAAGWYKMLEEISDKLSSDIRDVQATWVAEHITPEA